MAFLLETERLALREWTPADAADLFAVCGDAEVMRYIGDGRAWTNVWRARLWLERVAVAYREHGYGRLAVVERASGRIVGSCGFGAPTVTGEVDFGYLFARSAWGRGYATEAARACLREGFARKGFPEVIASVAPENLASRRVLEKIGFKYVGLRRFDGEDEDSLFFIARNPFRTADSAGPAADEKTAGHETRLSDLAD